MIFNPWKRIALLQEQMVHHEAAVKRLMHHNQILAVDMSMYKRELSLAHAALRRKNKQLKLLRKTKP